MAMNASLENVLNINTTHWRISDALEIVQASSSPIEVRRKVGSVLHLYYSLGWTAHDLRMAMTNAVRVPSGGRNHGRPPWPWRTAMEDGHGGWPWRTAVVDEEVENLEEKALHLLQHFLPLVARLSKSVIEFQD
jgi:hypothetical protein